MLKRFGMLAMLCGVCGAAAFMPQKAQAQDGYYGSRYYRHDDGDRRWDRHEAREWREHERDERRDRRWRDHEWREHERYEGNWRDYGRPGYGFYWGSPAPAYRDPYCPR